MQEMRHIPKISFNVLRVRSASECSAVELLSRIVSVASNRILDSCGVLFGCVSPVCCGERLQRGCKQTCPQLQFWVDAGCHTVSTKVHFAVIHLSQRRLSQNGLRCNVNPWSGGEMWNGEKVDAFVSTLQSDENAFGLMRPPTAIPEPHLAGINWTAKTFYPQDNCVIGSQCCRFYCHITVCEISLLRLALDS